MDYISYNKGNKCQLMLLHPNQFDKRNDFWIINISWLWLFPNLIPCSFDIFDKSVFAFIGINSIVFFFLATILIMAMFNFQFWVKIKISSWHYLTCFISLLFSQFLICIFWYCIILIYCIIDQIGQNIYFLHILSSFVRPQVKTDYNIQITAKENVNQVIH